MNMEALEQKLATQAQRPWMLRCSGTWEGDPAEVESSIQDIRQKAQTASKKRIKDLVRGLSNK